MSFSSDSPDAKKPCKGILKSSSSFDKHQIAAASSVHRKSAKFDELNVLQTYHPPDKDYGHMKVDEPKTPFNYVESADVDQLDAELLAERLRVAADSRSDSVSEEEEEEEEEEELTEEQQKRKLEFEKRRKAHYNEFEAVKLARKLIEEDEDDDEDGNKDKDDDADDSALSDGESNKSPSLNNPSNADAGGSSSAVGANPGKDETRMDIEEPEELNQTDSTSSSKVPAPESQAARLKTVASLAILEESSDLQSSRSSVIALIMIVSIGLMIFFIICFTLLFYLLKRNN
ncbi:protein phosphatase inhibitor 2 [Anopheles nili]|uniref:protein phosphatase inhibitor 2 n=1 Tax=Anopheles nili TaxID=185578 RepID=UPI00237C3BD1|nr:protein phosphatase inhibitor 2 [Anopheles nili]